MRVWMNEKRLIDCFPEGYTPRKQQVFILNEIERHIKNGVKYIIINAPTGIGKSLIAMAIGNYFKHCYICTGQKSLQDQYIKEFGDMATTVKGRANFKCLDYKRERDGDINNCDYGWCTRNKDPEKICHRTIHPREAGRVAAFSCTRQNLYYQSDDKTCEYQAQKAKALNSKIVIANYDYVLAALNYIGDFCRRDVIVSDEGHGLEAHIANFVTVDISSYFLDRLNARFLKKDSLNFAYTNYNDSQEVKFECHFSQLQKIYSKLLIVEKQSEGNSKDAKLFNNALTKIRYLLDDIEENRNNWVVKEERTYSKKSVTKIQFCPIFIHQYAKKNFFSFGKVNIIMSATILAKDKEACNRFAADLGIKANEYEYITVPQVFPWVNSLIYNLGLVNLRYSKDRSPEQERMFYKDVVKQIDLILDLHPNAKGIIHCHTKKISALIDEFTTHKDRIITHDTKNRADRLKEHCDSKKPTVLCSPSMHEGVDLKDELSRFQIIVKIQYPNIKEERIEQRLKLDPTYIDRQASLAFAQALGRSVRSSNDYARTYTIDSRFTWFISKNHNYLSGIVENRIIPANSIESNLRACHKNELMALDELFKRN
jgi:Rad3-related DNA helicase